MTVREILKMGDERLLRVAKPVRAFDTPELHALIADMFETMHAVNGAGLAAPQIGVDLALVIFGFLALNPVFWDAAVGGRVIRENLYVSQGLGIIALALWIFTGEKAGSPREEIRARRWSLAGLTARTPERSAW